MAIVIKMPALSPTMQSGKIIKWHKSVGEQIKVGEVLVEIETDKAIMEVEATDKGILGFIVSEACEYNVGCTIAIIKNSIDEDISALLETSNSTNHAHDTAHSNHIPEAQQSVSNKQVITHQERVYSERPIKISPIARKLAKEYQIDYLMLAQQGKIIGSGPGQRIIKTDIEVLHTQDFISSSLQKTVSNNKEHIIIQSKIRSISAKRLSESKQNIPHFYVTKKVHVDKLVEIKNHLKHVSISLNDLLMKIIGKAAAEYNIINSHYINGQIHQFDEVNLGFAVNTDDGILVPIIENINCKSLQEISCITKQLITQCRSNKMLNQKSYSTITVSNLGMMNIDAFSAIINPPEVAIIAIGAICEETFVKSKEICIGSFITLTGSFDHRVVDGVIAAQFMNKVAEFIENPFLVLV